MSTPPDLPRDALIAAALDLIATRGWLSFRMSPLANAADMPLAAVYRAFPDKEAVLAAYLQRLTERAAEGEAIAAEGPARDRLFDAAMQVFEAAEGEREPLRVLRHELARDPLALLALRDALSRVAAFVLDRAGLETGGFRGAARVMGLGAILMRTLPQWLDDEPGLAKTMAALDRGLRRAESWACRFEPPEQPQSE